MIENNATRTALIDALLNPRRPGSPGRDVKYGGDISPMITGLQAYQDALNQRRPYASPIPSEGLQGLAPSWGPATSPMIRGAANTFEQRGQREQPVYDPPPVAPLPFGRQYRHAAPADADGRLTHDMEGRPLGARYVSGLTEVDGLNVGLRREEISDIARRLTGREFVRSPRSRLGWSYGQTDGSTSIEIRDDLPPELARKVEAHELSHVIDKVAGFIPVGNHREQLRSIYNTLNNPRRTANGLDAAPGNPFVPFQRSRVYTGEMADRELVAEAIRVYLVDPNYIKTVAPELAAAIRDAVNSNPRLAPIIQLNNLGLPTHAGAGRPFGEEQTDIT